jgi:tetratricopeptide (TPR) repeat protein
MAGMQVRVGIATGVVIVGDLIGDGEAQERSVVGETPNLAARLQAMAEPDSVVIAASTRRLLGDVFEWHYLGTAPLKGIAEPVPAWQVVRSSAIESRFEAFHSAALAPLVGRTEQTALLLHRWNRAQAGSGNVVLLSGEPGIGKSRLVRELRHQLADRVHIPLTCYCAPHLRDSPYHPFVQRLEYAAGFARGDGAATRLAKLRGLLAKNSNDPEVLAPLAELLSIPNDGSFTTLNLSPKQRRERTAAALVAQVVAAAARAPVLLVFEDVQWMDHTSLEILDALVDRVIDLPVLLIVTFRPEFSAPWSSHPQTTTIVLNRLDRSEAAQIVAQESGGAVPEGLRQRIVAQADGVPLFLEELTKTILEGGAEASAALPATLHDSLMERLDRLAAAKRIAQIGAAIGRSFSYELVAGLSDVPEKELCSALDQLVSSGLVSRRGSPPNATYTFKHALVQTAAYESMLKRQRAAVHARIVELLLAQEPGIDDSQPDLLAYHCELAGLTEKAAAYYTQAGWRSNHYGAYEDSREQFRNALRLAGAFEGNTRNLAELRALRGFGLTVGTIEGWAAANFGAASFRALELCEQMGYPPESLGINSAVATFQLWRCDVKGELTTAERLLRWGQSRGDIRGCILGELIAGRAMAQTGELAAGRLHLQRALELLDSCQNDPAVVWTYKVSISRSIVMYHVHFFLSRILCSMGYPEQAQVHGLAADELREDQVVLVAEPMRLLHHLWLLSVLGEPGDLVSLATKMEEHCHRYKLMFFAVLATIMRGCGVARSGQPRAGQLVISDGLAAYTATGAVRDSCSYRGFLAETHRLLGETDLALSVLATALEGTSRTGEKWYDAELYRGIGETYYQRGNVALAEQSFRQALAVARDQGARLWELNAATSYARLLHDRGEPAQARALLAPVYNWFSEGFETAPLQRARLLLDELEAAGTCRRKVFRQHVR